jgi:hypothetical protein
MTDLISITRKNELNELSMMLVYVDTHHCLVVVFVAAVNSVEILTLLELEQLETQHDKLEHCLQVLGRRSCHEDVAET